MCACLGITGADTIGPPPYIKVLAMNRNGMDLLKKAKKTAKTPIITKPASARKMSDRIGGMLEKEAAATDFYSLAYPAEDSRIGGQEWRAGPVIIDHGVADHSN